MANKYWVPGGTTTNWSDTTNWSLTSNGTRGAAVPTSADAVFFDQASTYTVTMTGAMACLDFTVSAGTVTFAQGTTPTLSVAGNWSIIAGTVWSMTGAVTFTATTAKTLNSNGVTINSPFTFNGTGGSWALQNNLTLASTLTTTLTAGTLSLGTYTLSTGLFSSASAVARTIAFGTGKIVTTSATTSTIWNTSTITNLTISGTPLVECQGGGTAVTKTISAGALTEANAISFSLLDTGGTPTYAFTAGNTVKNLIVNGAQTVSNIAITIYGAFTHQTTNGTTTFGNTPGTNAWTFAATSGSYIITNIAGFTYDFPWTFGSAASTATWTLAANLTLGATRQLSLANGTFDMNNKTISAAGFTIVTGTPTLANTGGSATFTTTLPFTHTSGTFTLPFNITTTSTSGYTFTAGTLALSTFTLTTTIFSSANANTRTLNFGTGKIVLNGSATATVWTTATVTGLTVSGTPLVECQGGGTGVTKTINTGALSEANSISFSLLETSGTVTYTFVAASAFKNLIFNGLQTYNNNNAAITIYGTFTHSTSNGTTTFTGGTGAWTFAATSGSYSIGNIAGFTYDVPLTFGSAASTATWTLSNNLTMGSRTLTLTNGTFDVNNKTITGLSGITVVTGSATLNNTGGTTFSTIVAITHTSGTLTLGTNLTTSAATGYTLTAGTLNLVTFTLTTPVFVSNNANARTLAFGTGQLALTGNAATIFDITTATSFATTGTVYINCTYTGATGTRTIVTGFSITQAAGYNVATSGTTGIVLNPSATDIVALTGSFFSINLTGFLGTLSNTARTIYGSWTSPSGITPTYTAGTNTTTFAATTSQTITSNGRTLDFPITFNGVGGTWTIQDNFTSGSGKTATLTAGTLNLNNFTFTTGLFSSSGAVARTLAFSTSGQLALSGTGTIFDTTTATSFSTTGTVYINAAATSGTKTIVTGFTEAQSVGYDITTSGTVGIVINTADTITLTGSFEDINLTGFAGTLVNTARTVYGSWTNPSSGGTYAAGTLATTFASSSTKTITGNGRTLDWPFTFNGTGSWALQSNFATGSAKATTLTSGTLDLNNFTYTTQNFSSSGAVARTLAFGSSGQLSLVGTGATAIFDTTTATNFTTTGTPYINCLNVSSTARTIVTGFTEAQASAGYSLAFSGTTGFVLNNLAGETLTLTGSFYNFNLTSFTGTLANTAKTIYGSWTNPSTGGTYTPGTVAITFGATTSQTITGNGRVLDFPFTFNGVGGSWTLQTNFATGPARTTTLTAGTLNLNNLTYTTGLFSSSGAVARTIAYGTGQLALGGTGTVFDATTATNFSSTGTVYVNASSVSGTKTIVTGFNETQATGYNVATSGSSGVIINTADAITLTGSFDDINLTGLAGSLANTARTVYGNWTTPTSGGTYTAGANATSFRSTSSQTITSNNRTLDFPLTFDGVGGTWTLQDNLTIGSTRVLTWNNGTLDLNNKTLSTPASITINGGATGFFQLKNTGGTQSYTTSVAVTHTTGELNLFFNMTFGAYTWSAGTITLNSYILTCTTWASTSTTARTFAFGTGKLYVTGSGAALFNMTGATSVTVSGTPDVYITNTLTTASTVAPGAMTEASSMNFIFTNGGAYTLTFLGTAGHTCRNVDLSAFAGTWAAVAACTIYGSFTGPTGTINASANTITFGGTGLFGDKNIITYTNLPFPVNFNGVGSKWIIGYSFNDTFNCDATHAMTFTNGTIDGAYLPTGGMTASSMTMTTGTFTFISVWIGVSFTHTSGTLNLQGGSFWLQGATLATSTYTFTAGTINLSTDMYVGIFSSANLNTRTLAFSGTGKIYVNYSDLATGATTVWNTVGSLGATTGWTTTGTSNIIVNTGTATAYVLTVAPGIMTETQSLSFAFTNSGNLGFLNTASYSARNVDFSGYSGTLSATAACTIYGSLWLGAVLTESASVMTFGGATAGTFNSTKTITTYGTNIPFPMTFNGTASTWTFDYSLNMGATVARALTIVNGTLDLAGSPINLGFAGSTMSVNTGTVIINNATNVNLPFTLTSGTCTFGGASGCVFNSTFTFTAGTMTLAAELDIVGAFTYTAGTINLSTYALILSTSYVASGATTRVINFGAGSYIQVNPTATSTPWNAATIGTFSYTGTSDIRINATGLGNVYTIATGAATEAQSMNFTFTGDFYSLSTTGCVFKNLLLNVYDDGTNFGTWTVGAITIYGSFTETGCYGYGDRYLRRASSASVITFAGATGSKTIDCDGGTGSIGFLQPVTFNGAASIWQLLSDFNSTGTNGTITLTAGTLQLNGYNIYANVFTASGSTARTIDFATSTPGLGSAIVVKGNGTPFTTATATNLTLSGTYPLVKVMPSAPTGTLIVAGSGTEAQSFSYWFYNGDDTATYTLNFLGTAGYTAKDVTFVDFTGTWAAISTGTVYGSLSLYGGTITASASALTFGGTSGTKTIQTNGISIPFPITFNGAGSTFQLINALTLSTSSLTITHTNGILDLNGYTLTTGIYTTAAGTKNITFKGGTLVVSGSGATAFNNAQPTNFTTTAGTGTGTISMTSATAKTFVGGGSTYNCTLSQDGSGALTISGSNTFGNIRNTVQPVTITFTAGTTQTTSGWTVNGTAGNLVTLNSSTAGTLANISKIDGGYMDYVSVRDLAFQPCSTDGSGALPILWYGGSHSSAVLGPVNVFGIIFQDWQGSAAASIKTYVITNTATTSWTVPADWNSSSNIIHMIGGGGGGAGSRVLAPNRNGGAGGGGGGYTKITNYSASPSTSVTVAVGAGGALGAASNNGSAGGTTVFGAYTAGGGGGGVTSVASASTGGAGGVGATYNGGNGGSGGSNPTGSGFGYAGGGGGGAAGPNGNGGNGGNSYNFSTVALIAGGGGGGSGGGTNGGNGTSGTFGAGGNNYLGTGGGATNGASGTAGSGGGGAGVVAAGGSSGSLGSYSTEILRTWGPGGGNGGPSQAAAQTNPAGGAYGVGGSGGGMSTAGFAWPGGNGGQGIIVIQYYPFSGTATSTGAFFAFF